MSTAEQIPAGFSAKDFKSDLKPIWCPGCGDFGVLQALYRALSAIGRAPHDIAFVLQPDPGRFHHCSFMLESAHDVVHAADMIGKYRIPVDVGPNRHGITRGATIYFYDPSGNRNEVFCGDYTWYPDRPPITWETEQLGRAIFYHDRKLNENFLGVVT